ncbi:MAG: hypothetical protein JNN00_18575 [Chitinophagaceae bacterium]|nr:hypothetical protein [Chitinophagaceae bacterium]
MRKILVLFSSFFSLVSFSQNVGIGTTTPNARLEIKDTALTKTKISSKHYLDTSQLIFSNRLSDIYGTDIILSSNQESGLRVIARSDLPQNNSDSILMITPSGRLGINKQNLPAYTLDVNGDVNTTGTLRVNGNQGASGQVLRSNGDGTMGWDDMCEYKYYDLHRTPTGPTNWTVPAGVTKICIELWGAGGGGAIYGGGGGGAYIKAYFTVTPGSTISYNIGAGGTGGSFAGSSGNSGGTSTATVGATVISAFGGGGASTAVADDWPGAGGTYTASAGFSHFMGMPGQPGSHNVVTYQQKNATTFYIYTKYGNGGDAGNSRNTGGLGNYTVVNEATSALVRDGYALAPATPGGGGGSFYCTVCTSHTGAAGQIIIHY